MKKKLTVLEDGLAKAFQGESKSKGLIDALPASKTFDKLAKRKQKVVEVPKAPNPEPPKTETSIRTIYHDGQFLPALCFRTLGENSVRCIASDPVSGVYSFLVPLAQHDKSEITQHGYGNLRGPYPPERYIRSLREMLPRKSLSVTSEAREVLRSLIPDIDDLRADAIDETPVDAQEPEPDEEPDAIPEPAKVPKTKPRLAAPAPKPTKAARTGPARTDGKELVHELAAASGLPPEKVRAKLRAAGMRAPYIDPSACRKALGLTSPKTRSPKEK